MVNTTDKWFILGFLLVALSGVRNAYPTTFRVCNRSHDKIADQSAAPAFCLDLPKKLEKVRALLKAFRREERLIDQESMGILLGCEKETAAAYNMLSSALHMPTVSDYSEIDYDWVKYLENIFSH